MFNEHIHELNSVGIRIQLLLYVSNIMMNGTEIEGMNKLDNNKLDGNEIIDTNMIFHFLEKVVQSLLLLTRQRSCDL